MKMQPVEPLTLSALKRKHSAALYAYFRVRNLRESCQQFMENPDSAIRFEYAPTLTRERVNERMHGLQESMRQIRPDDDASRAFLEWRMAETKLLKLFLQIYQHGQKVPVHVVEEYRAGQVELYGEPDERLFGGIITYLRDLAVKDDSIESQRLMAEISGLLGNVLLESLYEPQPEAFAHYQRLFREAFPELHTVTQTVDTHREYDIDTIKTFFEEALKSVGADKKGWKVRFADGGANIAVSKYRKQVVIGKHLNPQSTHRLRQIIAHEVGCHVQGALSDASVYRRQAGFDENDEGLAIVLEQILGKRFIYKRSMRYLAVCLAYGVDGVRRDFREVHEVLWRAMMLLGQDEANARERAFYETVRVFRGGMPGIPGAAYIKDKVYLESNLLAWHQLEKRLLDAEEFRRLFKSHDTIWTKDIVA